jgi:hypothetical protein
MYLASSSYQHARQWHVRLISMLGNGTFDTIVHHEVRAQLPSNICKIENRYISGTYITPKQSTFFNILKLEFLYQWIRGGHR